MKILQTEIRNLQKRILELSALAEQAVRSAIAAVENHDAVLARAVIEGDRKIDEAEVELEEECLKVLALHQPVAVDLRVIVALLKINSDLERIGDYGVSIAKRAVTLSRFEVTLNEIHPSFGPLVNRVTGQLKAALDAFVAMDTLAARKICREEDEVELVRKNVTEDLTETIRRSNDAKVIDAALEYLRVARSLERINEHAANIAEDIIYMVDGVVVRHNLKNISQGAE